MPKSLIQQLAESLATKQQPTQQPVLASHLTDSIGSRSEPSQIFSSGTDQLVELHKLYNTYERYKERAIEILDDNPKKA